MTPGAAVPPVEEWPRVRWWGPGPMRWWWVPAVATAVLIAVLSAAVHQTLVNTATASVPFLVIYGGFFWWKHRGWRRDAQSAEE